MGTRGDARDEGAGVRERRRLEPAEARECFEESEHLERATQACERPRRRGGVRDFGRDRGEHRRIGLVHDGAGEQGGL